MPSQRVIHQSDNAFELISATSAWVLARHQWLIDTMRCVLTGEQLPTTTSLVEFEQVVPKPLQISTHTAKTFDHIKNELEKKWLQTTKTIHPLSGKTLFEQLNAFQTSANEFMQSSNEANQQLVSELTIYDTLTGALSRLTLNSCLSKALYQANHQETACVAFLDQQGFKAINDKWGHGFGDIVLAKTAELIQENLRKNDKLFRYGGDEWLVLLPNTQLAQAEKIIKRIQQKYREHAFKTQSGETLQTHFHYGIAESQGNESTKSWIEQADKAYYQNKVSH